MKQIITLGILALWGLGVTISQAEDMHMHMHEGPPVPSQYGKQFENFASEMNVGMAKMMTDMHAPGYTGDPDIDFLEMMIPHHEGAVDMARLVLEHGTDPVTRKLEVVGLRHGQLPHVGTVRPRHENPSARLPPKSPQSRPQPHTRS